MDLRCKILQVSTNIKEFLGVAPSHLIGLELAKVSTVKAPNLEEIADVSRPVLVEDIYIDGGPSLVGRLHRVEERLHLELEFAAHPYDVRVSPDDLLLATSRAIGDSETVEAACQEFVDTVRQHVDYDGVLISRQDGKIVGGSAGQQQDLMQRVTNNPGGFAVRTTVDQFANAVPIHPESDPETGQRLNLSHLRIRGVVDECRSVFRDAGVRATTILPIFVDDSYWGILWLYSKERYRLHPKLDGYMQLLVECLSNAIKRIGYRDSVAEELRTMSRSKGDFLTKMSQEIRSPLSAITSSVGLLVDDRLADDPAELRHSLDIIRRNANHVIDVVNDIVDVARIELGILRIEQRPIDPCQILEEVVALTLPAAEEKGLAIRIHRVGEIPPSIVSDPTRLRQIIVNLITNAVKFTQVGEVIIRVQHHTVSDQVEFAVSDTGVGMTPEQLRKVASFDAFPRAGGSINNSMSTGLGLRIAESLARILGGGISVDSVFGVGSTFTVRIKADGA